jgi:A/G-specific adenine glycosylase
MNAKKTSFIKTVQEYYAIYGRHDLPWRKTKDPYKIAVSEIMLQQTQVGRVIEKYKEFLKAFPTAADLAAAPLQKVLLIWSGLGYNRRARFLQQMALTITNEYNGKFPKDLNTLLKLPGIGNYTAGAISAFAFNQPFVVIETNIRTAYLHHFFSDSIGQVSDKEVLELIKETLDAEHPREWYWALMDYGSYLKAQGIKIHRNSAQYKKQSAFKGSPREVRGGILKILTKEKATVAQLEKSFSFEKERIIKALETLISEEFINKKGLYYSIRE